MYHRFTEEELRALCRTSLESLEMWARRLIHEQMVKKYGEMYMNIKANEEDYLIKKDVRSHVQSMLSKQPDRFLRPVDTLFLDHIIYFLCNPKFYPKLFKEALDYSYPQGCNEAREFLNRLIPIRNQLSHSNPISVRQAEQAICYSHDFVEGLKEYYKDRGLEKVWNVPRIIRITDSFGNVFDNPVDGIVQGSCFNIPQRVYCGDIYSVDIEVDASFSQSDYDIIWTISGNSVSEFNNCVHYSKTFVEQDVSENLSIECQIISHKNWHRYKYFDCRIMLFLQVFPPIE